MAAEALSLHINGMVEDGETVPDPMSLDLIMSDAANQEAVAFLVDLATKPSRSVRINVTLPEDLIDQIDRLTRNRSGFLAEAARAELRVV